MGNVEVLTAIVGKKFDVLVIGSGPAALAIAVELASAGLSVCCLAPDPERPWLQRFGIWADELPAALGPAVSARFDRPLVGQRALDRPYLCMDTAALQRRLLALAAVAGVQLANGRALRIDGRTIVLAGGGALSATMIVDASGAGSAFVARVDGRAPAYQSAFGLLLEVTAHPYGPGEMAFIDVHEEGEPPTFLYAMPLGDRLLFAEETSLAARPAMAWTELQQRLWARLARMGIGIERVIDRELCRIPLGLAPPVGTQPVVAFGAAASLTHPASGYQLGRSLALAPKVARAMVTAGPSEAARAAYAVMWPATQRRAWELYTLGMEVLIGLDAPQLRAFMVAFFELEPALWRGYLDATLEPIEVARAMLRLFARAPTHLRTRLARAAISQTALLRGAIAPEGVA